MCAVCLCDMQASIVTSVLALRVLGATRGFGHLVDDSKLGGFLSHSMEPSKASTQKENGKLTANRSKGGRCAQNARRNVQYLGRACAFAGHSPRPQALPTRACLNRWRMGVSVPWYILCAGLWCDGAQRAAARRPSYSVSRSLLISSAASMSSSIASTSSSTSRSCRSAPTRARYATSRATKRRVWYRPGAHATNVRSVRVERRRRTRWTRRAWTPRERRRPRASVV